MSGYARATLDHDAFRLHRLHSPRSGIARTAASPRSWLNPMGRIRKHTERDGSTFRIDARALDAHDEVVRVRDWQ